MRLLTVPLTVLKPHRPRSCPPASLLEALLSKSNPTPTLVPKSASMVPLVQLRDAPAGRPVDCVVNHPPSTILLSGSHRYRAHVVVGPGADVGAERGVE